MSRRIVNESERKNPRWPGKGRVTLQTQIQPSIRDYIHIKGIEEGHRACSPYISHLLTVITEAHQTNAGQGEPLSAYIRRIISADAKKKRFHEGHEKHEGEGKVEAVV